MLIKKKRRRRRGIVLAMGEWKSGKTYFALHSTPGKIDYHNFDHGVEGIEADIPKFSKRVRVLGHDDSQDDAKYPHYSLPFNLPDDLEECRGVARPIYESFRRNMGESFSNDSLTNVIDTSGRLFDLTKNALVGSASKVSREDDPFNRLLSLSKKHMALVAEGAHACASKNMIFIARAKQVWEGGEPVADKFQAEGWDQLPFEAQVVLFFWRTIWQGEPTFHARVEDSRFEGKTMIGQEFEGDEVNFPHIMSFITGSDAEEWAGE